MATGSEENVDLADEFKKLSLNAGMYKLYKGLKLVFIGRKIEWQC